TAYPRSDVYTSLRGRPCVPWDALEGALQCRPVRRDGTVHHQQHDYTALESDHDRTGGKTACVCSGPSLCVPLLRNGLVIGWWQYTNKALAKVNFPGGSRQGWLICDFDRIYSLSCIFARHRYQSGELYLVRHS